MPDDYGKRLTLALRAVEQMHADTSKLLVDFDKRMGNWRSVFGNYATRDLTYNVSAERWMAEGVYRFYAPDPQAKFVRALTVCFLDPRIDEPILLVGEIFYHPQEGGIKTFCREWDLWTVFLDLNDRWIRNVVLHLTNPDPENRIKSVRMIAVPLYGVSDVDQIELLMKEVTGTSEISQAVGTTS